MRRIAPGYVVAIAIVTLIMEVTRQYNFSGKPLPYVNGSLWTIPYEVECYVLLLIASLLTRHAGIILGAGVVAALFPGYLGVFLGFFALGSAIASYKFLRAPLISFFMIALGYAAFHQAWAEAGRVLIAPAAIWLGTSSWRWLNSIGRHGDISYGVYLYAFPLQQGVVMALGPNQHVLLLMTLAILSSIAAGIASWRLVERPALAIKPKQPAIPRPFAHEQGESM